MREKSFVVQFHFQYYLQFSLLINYGLPKFDQKLQGVRHKESIITKTSLLFFHIWEWCQDWYADRYESSPEQNPQGPKSGNSRVVRGGSFYNTERYIRCSSRGEYEPDYGYDFFGFRVVLSHESGL